MTGNSTKCAPTVHADDGCTVHFHRHDKIVNCPIKLSNYKHDAYTVLLVLKSGW